MFHVMGIGQTTIILGHMWLMEHNPNIDWHTREVTMTCCPSSCGLRTTLEQSDWPILGLADSWEYPPKTKSIQRVHIEEVPEDQPEPTKPRPPSGFTQLDMDEMSQGEKLFVCFIGHGAEVGASQTVSQRLAEAAGETHSMCFKDIVPKPYQEFKDIFAKESFDELPDWKKWDHTIELVPYSQVFSTKVYPLAPVKQKQLDDFLDENLKSQHICPSKSDGIPSIFSSSSKRRMGASTSSRIIESSM